MTTKNRKEGRPKAKPKAPRARKSPAARAGEARYQMIQMDLVQAGPHARALDQVKVYDLAKSIEENGLLQPIGVRPCKIARDGRTVDGYEITFGHHRCAALRKLNYPGIPAIVQERDEMHRELAAIDENLIRAPLSDGERIRLTARSQEIYETLHPETRQHAVGGHAKAKGATAKLAVAPSHAKVMAKRTGRSERSIRRDQQRGKNIVTEAYDLLDGTIWDDTSVWAALAKLRQDDQLTAIKLIKERGPILRDAVELITFYKATALGAHGAEARPAQHEGTHTAVVGAAKTDTGARGHRRRSREEIRVDRFERAYAMLFATCVLGCRLEVPQLAPDRCKEIEAELPKMIEGVVAFRDRFLAAQQRDPQHAGSKGDAAGANDGSGDAAAAPTEPQD